MSSWLRRVVLALVATAALAPASMGATADDRFDEANDLARTGDSPGAIDL